MATTLSFNKVVIGATTIDTDEFVYGTGVYELTGFDVQNTTADGVIHHDRINQTGRGQFTAYGDKTAVGTVAVGFGALVTLYLDSTSLLAVTSIVLAEYNSADGTTRIAFLADEIST